MSGTIHQEIEFEAPPETVYAQLTDSRKFSAMTGGAPTDIEGKAGGAFSCFGGMIEGRNVECLPGTRLVQAWRAKNWAPGVYSIVRFELESTGEGKTKLIMDHDAFPQGQAPHLEEGWQANYWQPMKAALNRS